MYGISRRALVIAGFATLACTGPLGKPAPFSTQLTAPWTEMSLPVQDGNVVFSDDAMLTVHHPEDRVAALTASYGTALEAMGFAKALDTSADDMTSITFEDDKATMALGILSGGGKTAVSITRYEK